MKQQKDYGGYYTRLSVNGKSYVLKGSTEESAKRNEMLLSVLDSAGNEVGDSRKLSEITGEGYYEDVSNSYLGYKISNNEEFVLVYFKLAETRNSADLPVQNFRFMLYDKDMQSLWERDVAFDLAEGKTRIGNLRWFYGSAPRAILLRNDGSVNVWASVDRGRSFGKEKRFQTDLYAISSDQVIHQSLPDINPGWWWMSENDEQLQMISVTDVKGLNLFGINFKPGGKDAFLFVNWDGKEKSSPQLKRIPFAAKHLSQNQTAKTLSKAKKAEAKGKPVLIPNYGLDEIIILEDGSLLVAGQQQYSITSVSKSGLTTSTKYYNKDIHIFHISADGEVNWTYNIPMFQYTRGVGHGYVLKIVDEKVYVLFNDNFKNLEKKWNNGKKPAKFSSIDNPVSLVSFNLNTPEEKQVRQQLWKSTSAGGLFEPEKFYSESEESMGLVYIQGGRLKSKVLKLNFQ